MTGELLTRATVWLAMAGYAVGIITYLLSRGNQRLDSFARIFWTFGAIALVAHVICAYQFFHHWSHASALQETARQTFEVYGFHWSGGIYINFLLMAAWCADAIWWWRGLETYRSRSEIISGIWHFFLLFIFFNATVIFAGGLLRWIGIVITLVILISWVLSLRGASADKLSVWKS
jgi:hypothetical protein